MQPNDPLTRAYRRMATASLNVLREAHEADRRGEDVGVYHSVLRQYRPLLEAA